MGSVLLDDRFMASHEVHHPVEALLSKPPKTRQGVEDQKPYGGDYLLVEWVTGDLCMYPESDSRNKKSATGKYKPQQKYPPFGTGPVAAISKNNSTRGPEW